MTAARFCLGLVLGAAAGFLPGATARGQARVKFPGRTFDIRHFGAKVKSATLYYDTVPIQQAIDACALAGGGTVVIPRGNWVVGPLFLRSNVRLEIRRGAELIATTDDAMFRRTPATAAWAANDYLATINIADAENVAVTGEGQIDGQGAVWWDRWRAEGQRPGVDRPRLVYVTRSRNILVSGVGFNNSPSYHLVFRDCADITVDHAKINAFANSPDTDAIDPIDTRDMLITSNVIACGGDVVGIASDHVDPQHPGAASGNITISDNAILSGRGVSIGRETAGGVRYILVQNNVMRDAVYGFRIATPRGRGGEVSDIVLRHNRMFKVGTPLVVSAYDEPVPAAAAEVSRRLAAGGFVLNDQIYPDDRDPARPVVAGQTPQVHDIVVDILTATGADHAGLIIGLPESPILAVTLKHVEIEAADGLRIRHAAVTSEGVKLEVLRPPPVILEQGAHPAGPGLVP